ncbi:50S ribosomal protein L13 [Phaeocystidibacter marisrubri]|nr:50S ribosomal protein L13 [Phaeocystidibacter marisrubri]
MFYSIIKVDKVVDTLSYKTVSANAATVDKQWVVVDAEGQALGRLASKVAKLIRGKHKPNFTPHVDCGDNVIIINAEKVVMSGNKGADRDHIWYTGYPGGQRRISYNDLKEKNVRRLVENAVRGMLPKNRLGRAMFKNLYVYEGSEHVHEAQQPTVINLNEFK